MPRRLTTEEFIQKAKVIHDNKYDYSKVEYLNTHTNVCIICPNHGEFWQAPITHIQQKSGCKKCSFEKISISKTKTLEQFITEAMRVHGDKYDYSKVEYIDSKIKVCIVCPDHGDFFISPNSHLHKTKKHGCSKCTNRYKQTTLEFIKSVTKIHNDKYDYSKVNYTGQRNNVCIICPEHGEFWQKAGNHIRGHGCKQCYNHNKKSSKEFIKQSNIIHDNKYDYSKVEYCHSHTNVCIICPEHGEFTQMPRTHLQGSGCPRCKETMGEQIVRLWLDESSITYNQEKRFDDCRDKNPLSFDFYVPKLNTCIEYDGIQHFESIEYFGGIEVFKQCQKHDQIKNNYCVNNGIKLIRIPYWDFDNIEIILSDILL